MDSVALVLGATGGIGRAVTKRLASAGYDVALHSDDDSRDKHLLKTYLQTTYDKKFETYKINFDTSESKLKKFVNDVYKDYGQIDVLVNCSGIMGDEPFSNVSGEELRHLMQINTNAPFLISKHVYNHMTDRGSGVIINLSSFVIRYGMGRNETIHYAMSKAALETMTFGLARIGGPKGVRCNCVSPGITDTPMQRRDNMEERLKLNPLRRLASPDEIAEAVMFCVTNQYMNGETIRVTGGE